MALLPLFQSSSPDFMLMQTKWKSLLDPLLKAFGSSSQSFPSTTQVFKSGSGTYATPTNPAPVQLKIQMVGGGGGSDGAGGSPTNGTPGGGTSFNGITANGGSNQLTGGTGGSGSAILRIPGGNGTASQQISNYAVTGGGGGSFFGPPTLPAGTSSTTSGSAAQNYGSGGSGCTGDFATYGGKDGAGGGEYVLFYINSPSAAYSYAVGAGGSAGTGAHNGGAGSGGLIIVEEYYQ